MGRIWHGVVLDPRHGGWVDCLSVTIPDTGHAISRPDLAFGLALGGMLFRGIHSLRVVSFVFPGRRPRIRGSAPTRSNCPEDPRAEVSL